MKRTLEGLRIPLGGKAGVEGNEAGGALLSRDLGGGLPVAGGGCETCWCGKADGGAWPNAEALFGAALTCIEAGGNRGGGLARPAKARWCGIVEERGAGSTNGVGAAMMQMPEAGGGGEGPEAGGGSGGPEAYGGGGAGPEAYGSWALGGGPGTGAYADKGGLPGGGPGTQLEA